MGFKQRKIVIRAKKKTKPHRIICHMYGRYELVDVSKRLPTTARVVSPKELEPGTRIAMGDKTLIVSSEAEPTVESVALDAVHAYGSLRKASKAIGLPFSTLREWVKYGRGKKPDVPDEGER